MKNVSNEYRRTIEKRRDFYAVAEITFQDGTQKTLDKKDFTLSGNSVVQSGESSTFPLGLVVPKVVKICLMNDDDRWSEYDFFGAKIFLRTKFDLDSGKTESINVGNFTVITPESYGTTIEITATDDSYKLDKEYTTKIRYPTTLRTALMDSCFTCGVGLYNSIFINNDFEIKEQPTNLTHRQFIGLCAMIAGGNAYFNEYNDVVIQTYDFSEFERPGLDGGYFDHLNSSRYESGDNADGGSFNPWNTGDAIDGGDFKSLKSIHVLHAFKSGIKIGTDDVVITGVKLIKEKKEYLYGKEGYVLSFENQLANGNEEEAVRLIGELIVGLQFRPFTGDHVAYPLADFMDVAFLVDRKGNVYKTVLTDIDFQYYGFTTLKCSADSPIRNSSKYYGAEVKAVVMARQVAEQEISSYDKAVQDMTSLISQGFGLYFTKVEQEDGSVKAYMHDKPTMAESDYIVTNTSNGLLVSTNQGTSWAIDKNGNALFNVISVNGLIASWIISGRISSKDGSVYFDLDKNEIVCNKMISSLDKQKRRTIVDVTPGENLVYSQTNVLKVYPDQYPGMAIEIGSDSVGHATVCGVEMLTLATANGDAEIRLRGNAATIDGYEVVTEGLEVGSYISADGYLSVEGEATIGRNVTIGDYSNTSTGYLTANKLTSNGMVSAHEKLSSQGNLIVQQGSDLRGGVTVTGGLTVKTGTKSRSVQTKNYNERLLYCYEMPTPMFGDIGEGTTDENGECIISLDDIFSETISTNIEYHVFLQKEGEGDIWVSEKLPQYFTVKGTKNLKFSWEIKARQYDFSYMRLEEFEENEKIIDYETQYMEEMTRTIKERERMLYETA